MMVPWRLTLVSCLNSFLLQSINGLEHFRQSQDAGGARITDFPTPNASATNGMTTGGGAVLPDPISLVVSLNETEDGVTTEEDTPVETGASVPSPASSAGAVLPDPINTTEVESNETVISLPVDDTEEQTDGGGGAVLSNDDNNTTLYSNEPTTDMGNDTVASNETSVANITFQPSVSPQPTVTSAPTVSASPSQSAAPTFGPTTNPSFAPTMRPSPVPSLEPTEPPEIYFGGQNDIEYKEWIAAYGDRYQHEVYLPMDESRGAAMHWSIVDKKYIELALVVRATGWAAFGISENGGMRSADVMIFEASQPNTVTDAHVMDQLQPIRDTCQSWELLSSNLGEDFLIVEVRRQLDTGDPQDRVMHLGYDVPITRIVAAWGDSETYGYHGPFVARGSVYWEGSTVKHFGATMKTEADGFFDVTSQNYPIKALETEYPEFCVPWNNFVIKSFPNSFTLIGFEPIIDKVEHVHHFTVHGFTGIDCYDGGELELVFVWAPGEPPLQFPSDVGYPFGGRGIRSLRLQVHYDNPELKGGVVDNSGVRFYYSEAPRPESVGWLQIGDPSLELKKIPINAGLNDFVFDCPASCSEDVILNDITVYREYMHLHATGVKARNELIRRNVTSGVDEIVHVGSVDFFNFEQQGNQAVQQKPFTVAKGDAFRTVCSYNGAGTSFGLSSQEEMCISFLLFWPRSNIQSDSMWRCGPGMRRQSCAATWTIQEQRNLQREFGAQCLDGSSVGSYRALGIVATVSVMSWILG